MSRTNAPSVFAQRLASELTRYGDDALEMAQVFEVFSQNKDREVIDLPACLSRVGSGWLLILGEVCDELRADEA